MHQDFVALYERWRQKAELFRQHGHEATARTYEVCSGELEAVLREGEEELLDLQEAARDRLQLGSPRASGARREDPERRPPQRAEDPARRPAEEAKGRGAAATRGQRRRADGWKFAR
jgi:hypothetical protein